MTRERERWNELYARGLRGEPRPPAEADSVPIPDAWGTLPESEWEACAFLLPTLSRARRWLDLGCGTGSVLAAFLRRFPHAAGVGVDASEVAVASGRRALAADPALAARMALRPGDLRAPPAGEPGSFDAVYALFSLQFVLPSEVAGLAARLKAVLGPGGVFAATVRSTERSVPASYAPVPGEPNTWASGEPHESGMIYHHWDADEVHAAAGLLGGRVAWLGGKRSYRAYDPAPHRAWLDFVIQLP